MRSRLMATTATIKPLFRYDSMWHFGIPPAVSIWSYNPIEGWHWRRANG